MNLLEMIDKYKSIGYSDDNAAAKICQDIILTKISKSKYAHNITIKGGVVIHNISNDKRRATRDLDLDFIKYSLDDDSIKDFISNLNDNDVKINITGKITPLHHQDYDGKRVYIELVDSYSNVIESKLDIGVHKLFDLKQDKYCFNFDIINESANLFINSLEQIFTEKLKSLLKLGIRSTRYKDIFDLYYLINYQKLDKNKLLLCFETLIYLDSNMKENNIKDIYKRFKAISSSTLYQKNLEKPKYNWLRIPVNDVLKNVISYIKSLQTIYN